MKGTLFTVESRAVFCLPLLPFAFLLLPSAEGGWLTRAAKSRIKAVSFQQKKRDFDGGEHGARDRACALGVVHQGVRRAKPRACDAARRSPHGGRRRGRLLDRGRTAADGR